MPPADESREEQKLTTAEAAALLGLSRVRVWQLAAEGVLPAVRVGARRRLRFHVRDLSTYLHDLQDIIVPEPPPLRTRRQAALAARAAQRAVASWCNRRT
jgi:excisionase family DNA binding protein